MPSISRTAHLQAPLSPLATGKLHIFDSYAVWQVNPKITLAFQGDYIVARNFANLGPMHAAGGAFYTRYQLFPKIAIAGRAEYLSEGSGLFSGADQALKEMTFTTDYKFSDLPTNSAS